MTSLTYPDGRTVAQSFDSAGRMNTVSYDKWGAAQMGQSYFSVTSGGYDPAEHLVSGTFGNGVPMSAAYDKRERIASLVYGPASALRWSRQYGWSPNSNLQNATDTITGVQRQFGYDTLNRLTSAQDIFANASAPGAVSGGASTGGTNYSGPATLPGASGAAPYWTDPHDSNLLPATNEPGWGGSAYSMAANATAPDGTPTAATVTALVGSGDSNITAAVASPASYDGETMSASVWLRVVSGTQTINLYIIDVGVNGWAIAGWKQVQVTCTWKQGHFSGALQNGLATLIFQMVGGGSFGNGQQIQIWNAMMEDAGTAGTSTTNFLPY